MLTQAVTIRHIALSIILAWASIPADAQQSTRRSNALPERENDFCISAGMGVSMVAAPGLTDYINSYAGSGPMTNEFGSGIHFFASADVPIQSSWSVRAEYSYLFKSFTLDALGGGPTELFYSIHAPSLLAQYVVLGKGYFLRFSGGGGYHIGRVNEKKISPAISDRWYRTSGVGIKFEATGQTAFDEHLYGSLAAFFQWEFLGAVIDDSGTKVNHLGTEASLSLFAAGVNFGLSYYF